MKWTFWTRTASLTSNDCETIDPLLSLYADGLASAEEAQRVETHLLVCPACRASLAWIQATQRTLAARPVLSPPADLRARIATAIAASSAAPLPASFTTRRPIALRPAWAAAASVAILGVVSYGLLHHPSQVAVRPVMPPQVAIVPSANTSSPVVKTQIGPDVKPRIPPHSTSGPRIVRSNPDRMARVQPDESQPEPAEVKTPAEAVSVTKARTIPAPIVALIKPHPSLVKKSSLPRFKPEMMAKDKQPVRAGENHNPLTVKSEDNKPETVVATAGQPSPSASVSVNVGAPSIKQDPTPTVIVVSNHEGHSAPPDPLSSVNAYVGQMRNVAYATERKSIKGIASTAHKSGSDGMAYVPGIWSPSN